MWCGAGMDWQNVTQLTLSEGYVLVLFYSIHHMGCLPKELQDINKWVVQCAN
jgi:hypothetical protein